MSVEKKPAKPLHRRELANKLIHQMLRIARSDPQFGQPIALPEGQTTLYTLLGQLVDVTWLPNEGAPSLDEKARFRGYSQQLDTLPPALKNVAIDFLAHAGQLHQMAGLLARESLLQSTDKDKLQPVRRLLFVDPGLARQKRYPTVEAALAAIAKPSFEATFTGHPTNTNSIESMRAQRELAQALTSNATGDAGDDGFKKATTALKQFWETPLLPTRPKIPPDNGVVNKGPAKDDIAAPLTVNRETDTMLYFMGNVYEDLPKTYNAFDSEMQRAYKQDYDPRQLKLGIKLHSWGSSGDKDGNANVNGDTTLMAIASHKQELLTRYAHDLTALGLPGLEQAVQQLTGCATVAGAVKQQAEAARSEHKGIPPQTFADLSQQLQNMSNKVDLPAVTQALEKAYPDAAPDKQRGMLDLLRRMRTFGTNFGAIEYRETAEEYERVVKAMVPGYAEMPEERRGNELARYIRNPQAMAEIVDAFQKQLVDQAGKDYSPKDPLPIAYQTLKRMELARDFPDMIQNNVLAECKKSSNMMEALFLQHAVAKDGKRAMLGVVPLFEEHEVLKIAPAIVRHTLDIPEYQEHLTALAATRGAPETQQIQLAHSDNAKRAGVVASRALIDTAHQELRVMAALYEQETGKKLRLEFFEGGSQSDCMRGGGRAISAMINAYSLHDFAKMTFQGGDLLNFFNLGAATTRLFTHNLANSIGGAGRKIVAQMTGETKKVSEALERSKDSYINSLFINGQFVDFLKQLGYEDVQVFGNYSSRAGSRKKVLEDIDSTRAIGLSETMQHADFVPTWAGVDGIEKALEEALGPKVTYARGRKHLYDAVPLYRDTIDRMMHGLLRTDLKHVAEVTRQPDGSEHPLMPAFRAHYAEAFRLCIESYSGMFTDHFEQVAKVDWKNPEQIKALIDRDAMRNTLKEQVYPHVADVLGDQERYIRLVHGMEKWQEKAMNGQEISNQQRINGSLLHNMLDTVHHGRLPLIDDPTYAREYCKDRGITRPWVQGEGIQDRQTVFAR